MALTITSTATKAAIASAAANSRLIAANNASPPPNASQDSAGNRTTNPPQGFEGPATGVPGLTRPSTDALGPRTAADNKAIIDQALGLVSQSTAVQTLAGIGTGTTASSSIRDTLTDLTGSSKTAPPSGDQGFASKPGAIGTNPITALNPMAAFQGQSVGGVLAAAATSDQPAPTSGAAGSGLVSSDPEPQEPKADTPPAAEPKPASTNWFLEGIKAFFRLGETGSSNENEESQMPYVEDDTGTKSNPKSNPGGGAGIPNPENAGSNINILTQTFLDQLQAAKAGKPSRQGGSGDVTPVDNGGLAVVANNGSIAANQASINQRNMVGQPGGGAIGENIGGGNKGLNDFGSNIGAGVINPGNEAGSPAGDRRFQQSEADALGGNQPAPPPPQLNPLGTSAANTPSEQTSSVSTTLAAGVHNLSLTGTASVNGTGNGLDNVIRGNAGANELRGEAGMDVLDGGAGRDQLTGGSGADRFRFSTAGAFGAAQADRITDFSRSEGDRIELSRSAFGLAAGTPLTLQTVSNDADLSRVLGSGTLLVQDLRDGSILFNQNGTAAGAGQGGVFAVVSQGLTLQAGDFSLIG